MNKKRPGYKPPPAKSQRPKKPTPPPPEKRGLTIGEIVSKYPGSVGKLVEEIERMKKNLAQELPEITDEWAGKKALKILTLIKQAQDKDLEDPYLNLHYLGLSLDIVDSIINDLRPKK